MITVVTGAGGSGKSRYAEQLVTESGLTDRYYVATMRIWDEEGKRRVERHRAMRAEKGFITIEQFTSLQQLELPGSGGKRRKTTGAAVLLECMSNLVLNEYYRLGASAADVIVDGIKSLQKKCDHLIIVTNEVFSDGTMYDRETMEYMAILGEVNSRIALIAASVTEVVYGIPVKIK